jgi:hypothetical protein
MGELAEKKMLLHLTRYGERTNNGGAKIRRMRHMKLVIGFLGFLFSAPFISSQTASNRSPHSRRAWPARQSNT